MANLTHLVLERDGHDQPWGFRLQGGADVGLPLSVQRVLVGTPSEGTLFKGDVIQKVSYTDTKGLSHQQAADLFNNAGNQIHVYVKRAGGVAGPTAAAAPLVNGPVKIAPVAPPVSGGVALPGIAAVSSVNCDLPDSTTPTPSAMSIQSQPHKYNPELGVGSVQHLRMQDDHITGVKEPSNMPSAQEIAKQKANELLMKEKVRSTSLAYVGTGDVAKQRKVTVVEEQAPFRKFGGRVGRLAERQAFLGREDRKRGVSLPALARKPSGVSKLGVNVFTIGGEVVQLKGIPKRKAVSLQVNQNVQPIILRKMSAPPRLPTVTLNPLADIHLKPVIRRKRKLGFVLSPVQYEEHSEEVTLETYHCQDLDYHVDPEGEDQVTAFTFNMKVAGIDYNTDDIEVEFTINLTALQANGLINGDLESEAYMENVMEEVEKLALGQLRVIDDDEEHETGEVDLLLKGPDLEESDSE